MPRVVIGIVYALFVVLTLSIVFGGLASGRWLWALGFGAVSGLAFAQWVSLRRKPEARDAVDMMAVIVVLLLVEVARPALNYLEQWLIGGASP